MKTKDKEYDQFESRLLVIALGCFLVGFALGTLLEWFKSVKPAESKDEE